jgi:DNA-directed RNA polymerase subunit RPC12/RpoP
MFFTVPCPHCGKPLKGREDLVGRTARCPYCRNSVTVTRPVEKPVEVAASTDRGDAAKPVVRSSAAAAASSALSVTPNVDVRVLLHILTGIVATAIFYAAMWPLAWTDGKMTYLGRLFIGTSTMAQGGWVPIAEVFLFFWAIGMLVEKWFKIRRQQRALLYDVLPTSLGDTITQGNLDAFIEHIRSLPKDAVGSFLVTRCVRGLEHFRVRKSAADTATMLSSQSDLDASAVDSSYTMFHVFIWAIPILGFLGTVIGVSTAVGSFTGTLENSSDVGALKVALKGITGGLATAFDTTLVALAMAMILTFPVSGLQKFEGDLVGQVDEYTNENLLRRLDDGLEGGAERGLGGSRSEMKRAFEEVMGPHVAQLSGWSQQLRKLGDDMLTDLQKGWADVDNKLLAEHARQAERIAQTERLLEAWSHRLGGIGTELAEQVKEGWRDVTARLVTEHERQTERIGEIDALVSRTGEHLAAVAADAAAARERAGATLADAAASVERSTAGIDGVLTRLADTITRLDGRQVILEAAPQRSWWSSLFGGRG